MLKPHIFWVTGLPGAGKSTFSKHLVQAIKQAKQTVIHLDGDDLRNVFQNFRYEREERIALAKQYARLAKLLHNQQYNVVVSTVSLFHEVHQYNAENLSPYIEIFLNPQAEVLHKRNQKNLYSNSAATNVVGKDIQAEFPIQAYCEFNNEKAEDIPLNVASLLVSLGFTSSNQTMKVIKDANNAN